jgi:hypothetical protein
MQLIGIPVLTKCFEHKVQIMFFGGIPGWIQTSFSTLAISYWMYFFFSNIKYVLPCSSEEARNRLNLAIICLVYYTVGSSKI